MTEKLEKCPFCGGDAEASYGVMDENCWEVRCKSCKAEFVPGYPKSESKLTTIAAWNTRDQQVVYCGDCQYGGYSATVICAYTCRNPISPCRWRITYADFGCSYGKRRAPTQDAD
jgi:hypothetical protein